MGILQKGKQCSPSFRYESEIPLLHICGYSLGNLPLVLLVNINVGLASVPEWLYGAPQQSQAKTRTPGTKFDNILITHSNLQTYL